MARDTRSADRSAELHRQRSVRDAVAQSNAAAASHESDIAADRAAELARQGEVRDAVFAATHDDAGRPVPIATQPGITIVEGKP